MLFDDEQSSDLCVLLEPSLNSDAEVDGRSLSSGFHCGIKEMVTVEPWRQARISTEQSTECGEAPKDTRVKKES